MVTNPVLQKKTKKSSPQIAEERGFGRTGTKGLQSEEGTNDLALDYYHKCSCKRVAKLRCASGVNLTLGGFRFSI